jgi:hypothetical protein
MRIPVLWDDNGFSLLYAEDAASWAFQPVLIAHQSYTSFTATMIILHVEVFCSIE